MAREYSHRQFFRRVPNALLARCFQEKHGVLKALAFDELGNTEVEPILKAFTALPAEQQSKIEAEFQEIEAMACQAGITALADEADFHQNSEFALTISRLGGSHEAAMWAFLEHPDYWAGAAHFLHSDNISESLWKKRNDLPQVRPHVHDDALESLAKAISHYFHTREGRGRNCKVEVFRRHEKEYFFAYPEDYAQSDVEWVRNTLSIRARKPAFEIIFVYCQAEGALDIYARRNTKAVPELQRMFARNILKLDELDVFARDTRVYVLDALADRDFAFQYPPDSGIDEVAVRLLRLSLLKGEKRRVTVEADPKSDRKAVYDLLELINPPAFHVTQAEIKVTFAPQRGVRPRRFKISYPNWCALRHDGPDLTIRKMLLASGIEPIEVKATGDDSVP